MDDDRFAHGLRQVQLLFEDFALPCLFICFFDLIVIEPDFTDRDDLILLRLFEDKVAQIDY